MTRRRIIPIGTTSLLETIVHQEGEISYDTTLDALRMGDGSTSGGVPVASATALAATGGSALVGFLQSGTGATARTGQAKLRDTIHVADFGAVGDGSTDDSAAIQAAITAAAGGVLEFDGTKTYVIETPLTHTSANATIFRGNGSTIKGGATRMACYINPDSSTGLTIEDFVFDMLQPSLPVITQADYDQIYNTAIKASTGWSYLTVRNCEFKNLYTDGIYLYQGSNFLIEDNIFRSPVQAQTLSGSPGAQNLSHVFALTCGGHNSVRNNQFLNDAITDPANGVNSVYMSGMTGTIYIDQNYSNYAGRNNDGTHRLSDYDVYGDAAHVFVTNNVSDNCMAQFMRLSSTKYGKVLHNRVTVNSNSEFDDTTISVEGVSTFGGQKGCEDIEIAGNTFIDLSQRHSVGVTIIGYDFAYPNLDIKVHHNVFDTYRTACTLTGPFVNVRVEDNIFKDGGAFFQSSPGTGITGTESSGRYDGLYVNRNVCRPNHASANGITFNHGTATTAQVGYFEMVGNTVINAQASSGQGIVGFTFSSDKTKNNTRIQGNTASNYAYNYYMRDGGYFTVTDNRSLTAGTADFLDGAGQLVLSMDQNRYADGKLFGTATLSAGTVTVSATEIRTGDKVELTRQATGGTLGHLSVGTIVNATSFVINSSDAADTSTVFWRIVH